MKKEIAFFKSPFPLPLVVVGAGTTDAPNASLYIWFSQFNENPPIVGIGIKNKRFTYELIQKYGEFSVNIPTREFLKKVDLLGTSTGRRINKFREYTLTPMKGNCISAPLISEFPISLEVKVKEELKFSDHSLIIGEVCNTWIDDELMNGRIFNLKKLAPILVNYSDLSYFSLGEKLNSAGFSRRK